MSEKNVTESAGENTDQLLKVIMISMALFVFFLFSAIWILPERCSLFSDNIPGGLQCDGFNFGVSTSPCGCQDTRRASVATIFAGLSFCTFLIPIVFHKLRSSADKPDKQIKIFN